MGLSYRIRSSVLADHADDAKVIAFRGSEGISRPYVFDVYIAVTGALDIAIDDAPGAKATLTIEQGDDVLSSYSGIVGQFELLRAVTVGNTSNALYLLRLVPHLWGLSLTRHSRIFSKQSIPEVIEDVLSDEAVQDVELRLNGSYEDEEHVTQYKESSLDFIHRWMEREGLYYFFEQGESAETLVIADSNVASSALAADPIRYHPAGAGDVTAGIHFDTFIARSRSLPATVKFTDYDYGKPQLDVKGSSKVSPNGMGDVVTYGNRFFTPAKGDALAAVRADDLRARAKNFYAAGPAPQIMAGYKFTLEHHPKGDFNTEYLAVTVEHHFCRDDVKAWGSVLPFDQGQPYKCEVTAILATQQYRHPETVPWPRIDGFENANVDGTASSEYAQLDDQGRYCLKFKFDEGTLKDGKASTWVRKMQPHAGSVEGWHFPERKGTEVVCAFMGGDPDRPVIVGAIPTAVHPSPVTSTNNTKNVIQTGGRNRFEMEDEDGSQRVTISTPHAKSFFHIGAALPGMSTVFSGEGTIPDHQVAIHTEGNSLINTCGTSDIETGIDWNVVIGNDHHEQIGANRVDEVGGFMKQAIAGLLLQDVTGTVEEAYHDTYTRGVQGDVTQDYKSNQTLTVAGLQKVQVGKQDVKVLGDCLTTILGVQVEDFNAAKSEKVAGACQNVFLGIKSEFVGGAKMDEVVGLNFEMIGGAKVEILGGVHLEIMAALHLEVAPASLNFAISEGKIDSQKFIAAATEAKAAAAEQRLAAMETNIAGVEETTCGIGQVINGLSSKQSGLDNKVSTLINELGGLHVKS